MKKRTFVVFTRNNARIVVNPEYPEVFAKRSHVVENPDLKAVEGVKPQHWKLTKDKKIVPMTTSERVARDAHVHIVGADNDVIESLFITKLERFKYHPKTLLTFVVLISVLAGAALAYWVSR